MSSSRHPLLERQLKRAGLTAESLPAPVAALLDLVDRTYRTADQDRYLLERSLTISSQEMQSLYEALRTASETRVSEMEKAVSEARESAEAASRAKSEFLANISHEIRTPLNAVIGMTTVLLGSELSPEHRDYVQTIRKSGEALLGLINEILDFSRLEAGRMPLEEHPFLLRERIAIAFELVAQEARRKGLRLSWKVCDNCPDVLVGDAARLQQVLLNLLYNAVKFTPSGEVTLDADLMEQLPVQDPEEVVLRFQITDTGVGLPPGRIEELFGPFLQADASTSRRYGGSGLGLAISRRLVERMGGSITAQGEPGRGSIFTFTVRFRRGNEEDLASAALLSREPVVPPAGALQPLRILLAEDNPLNQKVARLLLEKLGYSADLAANGHEVLAALERQDYDVVLMDVMMPELDGLEATRRIVARWPPGRRPRIVALTASAMREDRERCLAAGMDEYLSKPIDLPALAETLQRAGRAAQASKEEIPSLPMIDELWRLDPQETVRLVESFLVHLDLQLGSLREAVAQGDGEAIERVAHSLRGASATLGLPRLPDSLGELINVVRNGDSRLTSAALIAAGQDAARERELLRKLLARRG